MADLGNIAAVVTVNLTQAYSAAPVSTNDVRLLPSAHTESVEAPVGSSLFVVGAGGIGSVTAVPARYAVAGNVKDGAVNVARTVRAYRRDNGILLGTAVSNAGTGNFSIPIESYNGLVFVVAFDADGDPVLNAKISDWVVPV